jgi:hypothetical protein
MKVHRLDVVFPVALAVLLHTGSALEQICIALKAGPEKHAEVKTKPCLTLEDCRKIGASPRGIASLPLFSMGGMARSKYGHSGLR